MGINTNNEPILDFRTPPTADTKTKVQGGDFARSLNEVLATKATEDKMETIISKTDTSFLETYSDEQFLAFSKLATHNIDTNHIPTVGHINKSGEFVLNPWAKELFPKAAHQNIQNFLYSLCELAFNAIYKENGEYQDDFLNYMNTYFGNDALNHATTRALLNSAALALTYTFSNILGAHILKEQEKMSRQQTINEKSSVTEKKATLLGALSNSIITILEDYGDTKLNLIEAKNQHDLKLLKKEYARAISELKATIKSEVKQIDSIKNVKLHIKPNLSILTSFLKWEDPEKMLNVSKEYPFNLFKNYRLINALQDWQELTTLESDTKNLSLGNQVEKLSSNLKIYTLKKECERYKNHLDAILNKELKDIISDLQKHILESEKLKNKIKAGKNIDLVNNRTLNIKKILLNNLQTKNQQELFNFITNDKHLSKHVNLSKIKSTILKLERLDHLTNDLAKPSLDDSAKIKIFSARFNSRATQTIFKHHLDSNGKKFLKIVKHVLKTVGTLGYHAYADAKKRDSFQFWKTAEQLFYEKTKRILPESTPGRKNKK